MDLKTAKELCKLAGELRLNIINSIYMAKSGHPGGSLSCVDFLTYLYFEELRVSADNVADPLRDRFVLSKGHAAPALYAVLARKGFFKESDLKSLRQLGSFLQGHPNMKTTPGVELSTGSLGQGISVACGMALSFKIDKLAPRVFCLLGDGELEEGQVWEALMFAVHNKLDNLCLIVDNNGLQIDGTVEEVAGLSKIAEKFFAFGFDVVQIDGHNFFEIECAINHFKKVTNKPCLILMKTKKGCGVSFMESRVEWHGSAPNDEQFQKAQVELKKAILKFEESE